MTQYKEWNQSYGEIDHQFDNFQVYAATEDNQNIYTASIIRDYNGKTAFGDLGITRTNKQTGASEVFKYGTGGGDSISSIDINNSRIVIAGYSSGDFQDHSFTNNGNHQAFVAKLSSLNNSNAFDWTLRLGTHTKTRINDLTQTANGTIYATGVTNENLNGEINHGDINDSYGRSADAFIAKISETGQFEKTLLIGSFFKDTGRNIKVSEDGFIYLAWESNGKALISKYSPELEQVWRREYNNGTITSFDISDDGKHLLVAMDRSFSTGFGTDRGSTYGWLASVETESGLRGWTHSFSNASPWHGYASIKSAVFTKNNEVVVVGTQIGNRGPFYLLPPGGPFLAQLDSKGERINIQAAGNSHNTVPVAVISDDNNNLYTTGYTLDSKKRLHLKVEK